MVRFLDIFKKLKPPETEEGTEQGNSPASAEPKKTAIKLPLNGLQPKDNVSADAIPPVVNAQLINFREPISYPEPSKPPATADIIPSSPPEQPSGQAGSKDEHLGVHFTLGSAPTQQLGHRSQANGKTDRVVATTSGVPAESPYSRAMTQALGAPKAFGAGGAIEQTKHTSLNLSGIIKAQETQEITKALELYDNLASFSQLILEQVDKKTSLKTINLKGITNIIQEMVSLIMRGDRGLLDLIYRSSKDNYLVAHLVNTCILSLEVGKGLGYSQSQLEELGLAAFLHDVGMQEVYPLICQQDKLSRQEYEKIKMHVITGVNLLKEIDGLAPVILEACVQHHERITGNGYRGLDSKAITKYAQIIGLADTFEAITHSRPYRRQRSGQSAIKDLIETASDLFDRKALKMLVKRIGIYPVGTWVELNTGEIARVIKANEQFPIRPVVTIIILADKSTPIETKAIDLTKAQNIYIKTTLDEEELSSKTPK